MRAPLKTALASWAPSINIIIIIIIIIMYGAIMPVQEDYFYSMVSPSKEIQDSLSVDEIFGFHAVDSRLQPLDWILSQ